MKNFLSILAVSLVLAVAGALTCAAQNPSPLNVTDGQSTIHIFPTVSQGAQLTSDPGPLLYHGGNVMTSQIGVGLYGLTTYVIYWVPPSLQDGSPATLPLHYLDVTLQMATKYAGHGLGNNNTQYYYLTSPVFYIQNTSLGGDYYLDTTPYPASGCFDPYPGIGANCMNDAQIQSEIRRVMQINHWTADLNHLFLIFTAKGEGSCFGSGAPCAYTQYCAYHSYIPFSVGSPSIIYANQPYSNPAVCQTPGTPSPNNDQEADSAASVASHEISEAITDPFLDAWYSAQGNEIGDLCAYKYGTNTWAAGKANQFWAYYESPINPRPVDFFELQMEFDNHTNRCVQLGP